MSTRNILRMVLPVLFIVSMLTAAIPASAVTCSPWPANNVCKGGLVINLSATNIRVQDLGTGSVRTLSPFQSFGGLTFNGSRNDADSVGPASGSTMLITRYNVPVATRSYGQFFKITDAETATCTGVPGAVVCDVRLG